MGTISLRRPDRGMSVDDLANLVAIITKELEFLLNGSLDVQNVRAKSISADRLNVDQLSAIAADLGKVVAGQLIGAYISTADGTYPRIDFSSSGNLMKAFLNATNSVYISPDYVGNPALVFDNGTVSAFLAIISNIFTLTANTGDMVLTAQTGDVSLEAAGDLLFTPGAANKNIFEDWAKIYSNSDGQTLQQALDAKPNAGITDSVAVVTSVDFTTSTVGYSTLNFTNGVLTSIT